LTWFGRRGRLGELVSCRYERASVIVSSNKAFSRWREVFGDDTVAAAMIDRLVHHAEGINLKGDSYRLHRRRTDRNGSSRHEPAAPVCDPDRRQ
jgi:DNA replication protein DnaC